MDYFTQKCVWKDVSAMEYDAEAHAFYVNADDFAKENERYYSFGVYNDSKEPFELAVLAAVRGEDGKLRLLYFVTYDL